MTGYLSDFFERFSYPEEARTVLGETCDRIHSDVNLKSEFLQLLASYECERNCDILKLIERMTALSARAGIHEYTGNLLLLICLSKALKRYYQEAGVDEEVWFVSMCDLKWKMIECREVYGIWGTFVADWFPPFFAMKRFGFGKLQFEIKAFGREYQRDGITLHPDSRVINVHIPRTGAKLDRESMRKSYEMASVFFRDTFKDGPVVFVCHSWLLYPRNKEVLSERSNLYAFISDFDVFEQGEYENYKLVWRLFDVQYDGNVDHLPQDSSLRRAYADWIRKGEKIGWGYGVYVYGKIRRYTL